METLAPSKYLTPVGGFCLCGPVFPQHFHRVDAQRSNTEANRLKLVRLAVVPVIFLSFARHFWLSEVNGRHGLAWPTSIGSRLFMVISRE